MGTAIVLLILAIVVSAAVKRLVRDRKSGKCVCGGDCKSCRGCH